MKMVSQIKVKMFDSCYFLSLDLISRPCVSDGRSNKFWMIEKNIYFVQHTFIFQHILNLPLYKEVGHKTVKISANDYSKLQSYWSNLVIKNLIHTFLDRLESHHNSIFTWSHFFLITNLFLLLDICDLVHILPKLCMMFVEKSNLSFFFFVCQRWRY